MLHVSVCTEVLCSYVSDGIYTRERRFGNDAAVT